MLRLEYRHNNAYDTVILVDEATGLVRSDWTVTPEVLADFCDCSQDPADWDDRGGDEHRPDDYGVLAAVREGHTLTAADDALWIQRVAFLAPLTR